MINVAHQAYKQTAYHQWARMWCGNSYCTRYGKLRNGSAAAISPLASLAFKSSSCSMYAS